MRLQVNNYGFDSQLPDNEEESVIENSEKMFAILSDAIYKDKPLAVIRELSCNARDAMFDAGKRGTPFRIKLPTRLDPVFRVEDDGIGIHPSQMRDIYLTYGRSSKTDDDAAIGALGLGSKSPFAYTKSSFIVKNRWHSPPSPEPVQSISEYTYFVFINAKGRPAISLVGVEPSDLQRGITVEFAVKTEDVRLFVDRAGKFFRYWKDTMPEFVDYEDDEVLKPVKKTVDGGSWCLEERDPMDDFKGAIAVMGNVPYPIITDSVPNMPEDLKIVSRNSFIVEFPLGSLAFAPSREDLSYDEFTCKNLIERLKKVKEEIAEKVRASTFWPGQSHLEFRKKFYTSLTRFNQTIRDDTKFGHRFEGLVWACEFIFGKSPRDSVTYDGFSFKISDMVDQKVTHRSKCYSPFSLTSASTRGKSGKAYVRQCTLVTATAVEEVPYDSVFRNGHSMTIAAGKSFEFDWQSRVFPKKKVHDDHSPLQKIFLHGEKFSIETTSRISVESAKVTFVVNDEGGVGEAKFRALIESGLHDGDVFFVRHNSKEVELKDLCSAVNAFIRDSGMVGSTVAFSSNMDDHRPTQLREKVESGKVKLCSTVVAHYVDGGKVPVSVYMAKRHQCSAVVLPSPYRGHTFKVFDMDELSSRTKPTLYVVKTKSRKEIFDDRGEKDGANHHRAMISTGSNETRIAFDVGLFDDVFYDEESRGPGKTVRNFQVLVLSNGQVQWLKKKGVKLVGVWAHAHKKVKEARENKDFVKEIEHESVMRGLYWARTIYSTARESGRGCLEDLLEKNGEFWDVFREYAEYEASKEIGSGSHTMMTLYLSFVDHRCTPDVFRADEINARLEEKYPILGLASTDSINSRNLHHFVKYIEASDPNMTNASPDTEREYEYDSSC